MRVVYVNHTAQVSGGERSLLTLIAAMRTRADIAVACPEGPLADEVRTLGVAHEPIAGTAGSLRLHPRHTAVALAELVRAAHALGGVVDRRRPHVVHANSIRAGIVATLPRRGATVPVVVHVRDCLPAGPMTSATRRLLARRASATIANSTYTLGRFALAATRRPQVIYNPVDLDYFDGSLIDRAAARARLALHPSAPVLAVIGQLTPWKGQDDAVRALALLRADHPDAQLLLVGSAKFVSPGTRFDNQTYVERLDALVVALGLTGRVLRLGERDDVPDILRAVDLVLVPSHEEPFGRVLVEALAAGVPVVATSVGGPAEIIDDGLEGVLVEPGRPDAWAAAITALLADPLRLRSMGATGRQRVRQRFTPQVHAEALMALYAQLVPRPW